MIIIEYFHWGVMLYYIFFRCGIIKTLSKILSHCEEGHNEDVETTSPKLINTRVSILYSINEILVA